MTSQTLHLFGDIHVLFDLLLFIFFSTVCSYNFHWYLTSFSVTSSKRILWTQQHKTLHIIFYFIGLGGSVFYFYLLRDHWIAISFGAFVTFLYSAPKLPQTFFKDLKKIAIGKTFFLAFVWTYVTTILPLIISDVTWKNDFLYFILSRFFLIYSICILFDYRDREDDKRDEIHSMITFLNERGVNNLFAVAMILFACVTIYLHWFNYSWLLITILLIPGIIVAVLYNYAKKNFSDYLYDFVLDGLMMLSALLMLVFRI
jgi:4-hydroxybenzoate polyprenyltransferase